MTVKECIRLVGAEFSEVSDADLDKWIEFVSPMVSKKQFGKLYNQAIALLICHKLSLAGAASEGSSSEGSFSLTKTVGSSFGIASISDGTSSISFDTNAGSNTSVDAEYGRTVYGSQYLQLRKLCVVPIHVSGENNV